MKKMKNGWVEGSAREFLELSDADMAYIETKRGLAARLRELRAKRHLTQEQLATRLQTSQSRVAKMEAGDQSVSLDLLIQALFRMESDDLIELRKAKRAEGKELTIALAEVKQILFGESPASLVREKRANYGK
jgi:transcriptional regulator with XRE-family HTH domain